MSEKDRRLYELVNGQQYEKPQAIWQAAAFTLNAILKAIPISILILQNFLVQMFGDLLVVQIQFIFIVGQFWFTKNIFGRRLVGIRWYFGQNTYGQQKLMYECRANEQYVSYLSATLFWVLQLIFLFMPTVLLFDSILLSPVLYQIKYIQVLMSASILFGGVTNVYFFLRTSIDARYKKNLLLERIGGQLLPKLGNVSIHSSV